VVAGAEPFTHDALKDATEALATAEGAKAGPLSQVLRVATTGTARTPPDDGGVGPALVAELVGLLGGSVTTDPATSDPVGRRKRASASAADRAQPMTASGASWAARGWTNSLALPDLATTRPGPPIGPEWARSRSGRRGAPLSPSH